MREQEEKPAKTEFKSYQSFQLQKRIKPQGLPSLPGSFRLFIQALGVLKKHAKLFLGMAAVYGLLYLIFVQGLTALNGLDETKKALEQTLTGNFAGLAAGAALFAELLGKSSALGATANTYQFLITIIASLALIWALRQVYANNSPRIRDGFYFGMYPLVPFLLVLIVVVLQLLPFAIGGTIFNMIVNNGIAATGLEVALWGVGFFVLALVSLYLVTSSVFALYIVSLPDMTPLPALRSARQLVRGRRWQVMRKILFLPLALLVIAAAMMIPVLMFATAIAGWVFYAYMVLALAVSHSYMYRLYRALI